MSAPTNIAARSPRERGATIPLVDPVATAAAIHDRAGSTFLLELAEAAVTRLHAERDRGGAA